MDRTIFDDYKDIELETMVYDFIINIYNKNWDYNPKDKRIIIVLLMLSIHYPGILSKGNNGWILGNCIAKLRKDVQ